MPQNRGMKYAAILAIAVLGSPLLAQGDVLDVDQVKRRQQSAATQRYLAATPEDDTNGIPSGKQHRSVQWRLADGSMLLLGPTEAPPAGATRVAEFGGDALDFIDIDARITGALNQMEREADAK